MKRSLLPFFSLLAVVTAQSASTPDSFIYPGDEIDFEACFRDLDAADNIIRDGGVRQNEFLGFIQRYASRKCLQNDSLNLQQFAAFNALSCVCASLEGQDATCCLGENGQLDTGGALTAAARTQPQVQFLTYACITIDNTLPDTACLLADSGRGTPPPVAIGTAGGFIPKGEKVQNDDDDDNVWDWLRWLLLALLLLLLLLCCCCCTIRRKRLMAIAEEEEEQRLAALAADKGEVDVEQQTEMLVPSEDGGDNERFVNDEEEEDAGDRQVFYAEEDEEVEVMQDDDEAYPDEEMMVVGLAAGGANNDDDDSEDGNQRRGAHNLPEDDDDDKRRIGGYGQLPPDEDPDPNRHNLRPIPLKDAEDEPDWDQPGRDINFPKPEPDEYSAGYDHDDIDGGVYLPERDQKEPTEYAKPHWERLKKETPEEVDVRKRRIQTGLGEAEVWNKLDEDSDPEDKDRPSNDVFDWVVQSALGVLDQSNDAAHVIDDEEV